MYRLIFIFLVGASILIFSGCSENNTTAPDINQNDQVTAQFAKKQSPNLIGTTYTPFHFPPLPDPAGSGLPIFWKGTVDFGEDTCGIYFLSHEDPRTYSQASPYYEDFVVHEDGNEGNVYVKGWNAGVVTYANNFPDPSQFLANGKITEAYGPFADWQGRTVHFHGLVYWALDPNGIPTGLPERAEGTLRIN
jgi:hypothetical protein